jgi:arabinofuranosyltransferase
MGIELSAGPATLDSTSRRERRTPWALRVVALPGLVVALQLATAWSRRWTTDDAFINFRVVKQIEAGHGPVFNAGERVEVATSSLWLAMLTAVDLVTPLRLEWAAVVLQLALGAFALVAGMAGALRLARLRPRGAPGDAAAGGAGAVGGMIVPLGAAAYIAVAVGWDFATGGLENSLGLAWLAGSFWAAVALVDAAATATAPRRLLLGTAALVGLGVLIRPDFVAFAAGFGLPVAVVAWRAGRARSLVRVAAAAAALPVVVQVLRMGYYGQLVPNTLHAKESGLAWWGQGWAYLLDFARPYALVVPVAATLAWLVLWWRPSAGPGDEAAANRHRNWRLVVAAVEAGAALHAIGVVRVGGDYMHGRLLLPTWFALLLPVFAVPAAELARSRRHAGIAALVGAWTVVVAFAARPPVGSLFNSWLADNASPEDVAALGIDDPVGIIDMRQVALTDTPVRHPVRWDDYAFAHDEGSSERGDRRMYVAGTFVHGWGGSFPTPPGIEAMVVPGYTLGARSYAEGLDVWVYDRLGLADPVVARAELARRGTAGHEKLLGPEWVAAAWVDPDVAIDDPASFAPLSVLVLTWSGSGLTGEVDAGSFAADRAAAQDALACGELQELVHDTRAPLSPQRFLGNIVDAVRLHDLRVPVDPHEARSRFCG